MRFHEIIFKVFSVANLKNFDNIKSKIFENATSKRIWSHCDYPYLSISIYSYDIRR